MQLDIQAQFDALLVRARRRGFQTALVAELERMGHPVKRQAISRWLAKNPKRRQKCFLETGAILIEAAGRIPLTHPSQDQ
jgi:hypothetical protein